MPQVLPLNDEDRDEIEGLLEPRPLVEEECTCGEAEKDIPTESESRRVVSETASENSGIFTHAVTPDTSCSTVPSGGSVGSHASLHVNGCMVPLLPLAGVLV